MAITPASQAGDVGSIPIARSKSASALSDKAFWVVLENPTHT